MTVYQPDKGPRLFEEKDVLDGGDVLPGLRVRVADLFAMPGEAAEPTKRSRKPRRK